MLGPQLFILSPKIGHLAQVERRAHRIERTTPLLPVRKRSPEHGQTVRFQIAIAGAFICDVSGGRGAIEQQFLLPVVARLDLQNSACQPQPARCIVGATVTSWPRTSMPIRKSFFWKAASASRRKATAGLLTVPASLLFALRA